jgi:GNAT superfamily N-acetyltransferase
VSVTIRFGEPGDVALIAELIRGLARYERLEHEVSMTEDRLERTLFGPRRYAEVLIAEDAGEAVGFALFFHNYSTFLAKPGIYLEDLYVREAARGKGVGKKLLARLAAIAVERDCGRLEWAVLDWNKDAIGFYERLGARPNSEWTVYRISGDALSGLAGQ